MPPRKLSPRDKEELYQLARNGHKQTKLAVLYGVSQGTISNAIKEQRYKEALQQKDELLAQGLAYGVERVIRDSAHQPINYTPPIPVNSAVPPRTAADSPSKLLPHNHI